MPSADHKLAKLIGLKPSVQRFMIYNQGCFGGASALRLAKDLAENNASAWVLIVCSEIIVASFQPPSNTHLDILIGSAIFADGAAALVVGSNPIASINERPLFQIVSASQTFIPESDDMLIGKVPFTPFGITEWENLFYVFHPGGAAILKGVEEKLGLNKEKLKASWHVLSEYGNMRSPNVVFVLNEMRKMSMLEGKATTGAGLEWGVLFGFGQGLTVETIVLRSIATNTAP
ncbi:hypothetical protein Goarm_009437 [Gossypium armourianum]|uniref:Chalcone synthase n=1 Tax=Gossypium armourianum TaxID=34283 RepID=A0A7J9JSX3_9ROSI|nr:hypothetical protein [Gossypium armourianum]